jgi:anti-sigma regulatory factor (Ser/Thr protein kinase)
VAALFPATGGVDRGAVGMHSAKPSEGGPVAGAEAEPKDRRPGGQLAKDGGLPAHWTPGKKELRHQLRHADLRAVAEVRKLLREQLQGWGVPGLADTAELLASELVTNALVHTDRGAVLTATLTGATSHRLRIEVYDYAAHHPKARVAGDHAPNGRGLQIVRTLADAWGVRTQPLGKTVWFELAQTA